MHSSSEVAGGLARGAPARLGRVATLWVAAMVGAHAGTVPTRTDVTLDRRALLDHGVAPTPRQVAALVRMLSDRDPAVREAAIDRLERLGPMPAREVVEVLGGRHLSAHLSALELLEAWGAPVGALDPWEPGSIGPALARLRAWLAQGGPRPDRPPRRPPPDAIARDLAWLAEDEEARATAAIERLARLGPSLLARVRALERTATEDSLRRRLARLRYRLFIPAAHALDDRELAGRIATASPAALAVLVDGLATQTGWDPGPLLAELVVDPHPLVRESALRALRRRTTDDAAGALGRMLDDPDPNVRAAVLKELAQNPAREHVGWLKAYVARESDEDLLVHGARALGATPGRAAVEALLDLSTRPAWRVRAEAVDALTRRLSDRSGPSPGPALAQRVEAAIVRLLEDADTFVAGKAIGAVEKIEMTQALPALVRVAHRHEGLAAQALGAIGRFTGMRRAAERQLRQFCRSRSVAVRAAAIEALARGTGGAIDQEVQAALADPAGTVREAAMAGVLAMMREGREGHGTQARGRWPAAVASMLERAATPLLLARARRERLLAAGVLAALGRAGQATSVVREAFLAEPALAFESAAVLADLEWPVRIDLLEALLEKGLDRRTEEEILEHAVRDAPAGAEAAMWALLARRGSSASLASTIMGALVALYFGQGPYIPDQGSTGRAAALVRDARTHLDPRRPGPATAVLALLMKVDPVAGEEAAAAIAADARLQVELRTNAALLLLWAKGVASKGERALGMLDAADPRAREAALAYFATGPQAAQLNRVTVGGEVLPILQKWAHTGDSGDPPKLPTAVTVPRLSSFLGAREGLIACLAALLMARLGDASGLAVLLRRWQADETDEEVRDLLVDAIVLLGDDTRAPVLERVYRSVRDDARGVADLYARLRLMSGPEVKALRRRIRKEVGPENLR